jgi:hypothetical protein
MSLINSVNLIISIENNISTTNKTDKKQWFNIKDERLPILWKYIFTIFPKCLNYLIW